MTLEQSAIAYGKALVELEKLNEKHATLGERIIATNKVLEASRALKEAAKELYSLTRSISA